MLEGMQGGDCSRTSILAAIEAEPTLSTVTTAIKALNVTSIIPDKEGPGTIFLPKDEAFAALGLRSLQSHYASAGVAT